MHHAVHIRLTIQIIVMNRIIQLAITGAASAPAEVGVGHTATSAPSALSIMHAASAIANAKTLWHCCFTRLGAVCRTHGPTAAQSHPGQHSSRRPHL